MAVRVFTNLADATKFATENGINPESVEKAVSQCATLSDDWKIEGVCEPTLMIVFSEYFQQNYAGEWETFYEFSYAQYRLKDVQSGNLYHLYRKDGKAALLDVSRRMNVERTEFYRQVGAGELGLSETPNKVGTPTAKKVRAWFDYWDEYYKRYEERLAQCKEISTKAFEDIKSKCDSIESVEMDEYLGVPRYFTACKSPLRVKMHLYYTKGGYTKSVEVDWRHQQEFLGF